MIRETSIMSYRDVEATGLLRDNQLAVTRVLAHHGPLTQGETWSEHFPHMQRHSIGPRFAELERAGVITCVGNRPCRRTGKTSRVYDLTGNLPDPAKLKARARRPAHELETENDHMRRAIAACEGYLKQDKHGWLSEKIQSVLVELKEKLNGTRGSQAASIRRLPKSERTTRAG